MRPWLTLLFQYPSGCAPRWIRQELGDVAGGEDVLYVRLEIFSGSRCRFESLLAYRSGKSMFILTPRPTPINVALEVLVAGRGDAAHLAIPAVDLFHFAP